MPEDPLQVDPEAVYRVRPIGIVRSEIRDPALAPKQGALAGAEAAIVVSAAYAPGLEGLARRVGSGKIVVICWMQRADRGRLEVHPRGNEASPMRGVFSTRSPHRPNPLSLHTVELLGIRGNVLRVRGMDAVDGTPVLDIKPHSPGLDD